MDRIGKVLRAIDFQIIAVDQKVSRLERRKNERIIGGKTYMNQLRKLRKLVEVRKRHRRVVAARREAIENNERAMLALNRVSSKPAVKVSVNQIIEESKQIETQKFGALDKFAGQNKKADGLLQPFALDGLRKWMKKKKPKEAQNAVKNETGFGLKLKYKKSLLKESDLNLPKKYRRDELHLGDNTYSPENGLPMKDLRSFKKEIMIIE